MKLVIQIPCYNEAEHLPATIADLPTRIDGIDEIAILVIDDGSTDGTAAVAESLGATVVRHTKNRGLAAAFMTGIHTALAMDADIIVNTDADNQYRGECIGNLIRPILEKGADMVVGVRPITEIAHFSWGKKLLQRIGSAVVRLASGTQVEDAPSGFRAFSREAALRINVFSDYSYTLETIIECGLKNLVVATVPVSVNQPARPSRLFRSTFSYIFRSVTTIGRIFLVYRSFRFLAVTGGTVFSAGFILGIRFIYYFVRGEGDGHVQSLILSAVLIIAGFQMFLIGIVTDLLAANRKMLEEIQYIQRKAALTQHHEDSARRP